jgi:uncharacterized RDD family membrane protein YckC
VTALPGSADLRGAARPFTGGATQAADALAMASEPVRYVGLVTRGVAFAIDAAVINIVAIFVEVGMALIVSLLHLPHEIRNLVVFIGAAAYVLWTIGYFVGFWSTAGQTPGNRVMQIRVVAVRGERLKPRRAFVRCLGLVLAALPLFAGYLIILFNPRRRGLQDYIARTLVIEAPALSIAEEQRQRHGGARSADVSPEGGDPTLKLPAANSSDSGDDRAGRPLQA